MQRISNVLSDNTDSTTFLPREPTVKIDFFQTPVISTQLETASGKVEGKIRGGLGRHSPLQEVRNSSIGAFLYSFLLKHIISCIYRFFKEFVLILSVLSPQYLHYHILLGRKRCMVIKY